MRYGLVILCWFAIISAYAQSFEAKVEGMLLGSALGDAAGAPYEFFYPAQRSHWSITSDSLTEQGLQDLAGRFKLVNHFRKASSFAQWQDYAQKGAVTDDTRLKIIFMNTVRHRQLLSANSLALEILAFANRLPKKNRPICNSWLAEIKQAANWQLGNRQNALPPDRLWGGAPGIAAQMTLIPLAALNTTDLEKTYKMAWELDFLDNGIAKDINAAIITGLAAALRPNADWESIESGMRNTDPYGYGKSRYGERAVDEWLDLAHLLVEKAEGNVDELYRLLEEQLKAELWWECWVPLVVVFACAEMAYYHPLASMQLCIEFGHDTDSYAQLMGAFMGALHGPDIFPKGMVEKVNEGLKTDFGEDIAQWVQLLTKQTTKTHLP